MHVVPPDGNRLDLPDGATGHDAAAAIAWTSLRGDDGREARR